MLFDQTFKNIKRTREIIGVLVKYGFEDVIANTVLQKLIPKRQKLRWVRKERPILEYSRWERVRMVCEELGPTFIKFAQVLSNRPDILPDALITEFQKLQSDVPPFEFSKAQEIIERETGKTLHELFEYFNETPIGSASIGQVHRARLKNGDEVVVKVQRPDVKKKVETDLSIMREIATRGDKFFEKNGVINVIDVVDAFERSMQKELDYNSEARNIMAFRKVFKDHEKFFAPKAYKELSTSQVLVIEFVHGCKITDIEQLKAWNLDPAKIAEIGMDIYLLQIFEYGFFHADPHPGNVLVRKDGVICLIDFGMIGTLMRKDKFALAGVFISMAQENPQAMAENLRKLSIEDNIEDMRALEYELNDLIEDFASLDVSEANMADFGNALQKVIYNHRIRVPGGVFIILRALTILEGIGKAIHPNFNTSEFIAPYGKKLIQERFSKENVTSEVYTNANKIMSFLSVLPTEMRDLLVKTRKGKLKFEIEHQNYERILNRLDRIANRMALTFIIVALLISSSIIMTAETAANQSGDIPYLSYLGLMTASGLSIVLLYAVLRSRNKRNDS